ncbi:MAG TPA: hypothetical protein PJ986_10600 [Gammaproteobacteria bacterium]|nr:hypothetical protein [Gammaproteobacteria bacterium]
MAESKSTEKLSDDRLERAKKRKAIEEEQAKEKRALKAIKAIGVRLEYYNGVLDQNALDAVRVLEEMSIPAIIRLAIAASRNRIGVEGLAPKPERKPPPLPDQFAYHDRS